MGGDDVDLLEVLGAADVTGLLHGVGGGEDVLSHWLSVLYLK